MPSEIADVVDLALAVLILHGTLDKVAKPSGSQFFYDMAGSSDKTLKLYEGHFHDLLHDVDKDKVMADVTAWIDAHLSTVVTSARPDLSRSAAVATPPG
jgi:alpha-beta hydrolase superfamily lysophospholipase